MKIELLKTHDPRRRDAIGLVRRAARSGRLSKKGIGRWFKELGKKVVSEVIEEAAETVTDEIAELLSDDGKQDSKKGTSK